MLTKHFEETLPNKPYCADDISFGLKIRSKEKAKMAHLIQYNSPALAHWLAFDIDSESAGMDWYDANGPAPNFIIQNPENGHAHYLFGLSAPVCVSGNARPAPMRYLAGVEGALTIRLGADRGYAGLVVKNPLNSFWRTWSPRAELYDLDELSEYCDTSRARAQAREREVRGFGRNVELFDRLRFWCYDRVEQAREESTESAFLADATARAMDLNVGFAVPLSFNEVCAVARSVSKWTWRHYDARHDTKNRGVLGYGANRATDTERPALEASEIRQRQKAGARYTNTARKASTEAKIKQAIAKLTLDGKKPTKASVARVSGVSRVTVSTQYGHLFD